MFCAELIRNISIEISFPSSTWVWCSSKPLKCVRCDRMCFTSSILFERIRFFLCMKLLFEPIRARQALHFILTLWNKNVTWMNFYIWKDFPELYSFWISGASGRCDYFKWIILRIYIINCNEIDSRLIEFEWPRKISHEAWLMCHEFKSAQSPLCIVS